MSKKNKKFKKQVRAQILEELQKDTNASKIASAGERPRNDISDGIITSQNKKNNEAKAENRGEPTIKKELLKILLTFGFLILVLIVLTIANQKNQFLDRGVEQIFSRF